MLKLSIDEILQKIYGEEVFDAVVDDNSFSITVEKYVPFICTAIHHGSNLNSELEEKINLNISDRWREEDPLTGDFISSLPIYIIANDSRYEYDLNREESECIYDNAWGKKIWAEELSKYEKSRAIKKHRNFYKVLDALVKKTERKFNSCLVYDIHSYNYKRNEIHNEYPIFNIGTERINTELNRKYITKFKRELSKVAFDNLDTTVLENEVFYGRGFLAKYLSDNFKNTLVFPLEIKKIYCDELNGDTFPSVIDTLKEGLKNSIISCSMYYINRETNKRVKNKASLLSNIEDPILKKVDKKLYSILKNFETLTYVNPRNLERCKKDFFNSRYRKIPEFKYTPLKVDIYDLKQSLYQLPVTDIDDVSIQLLYKEIIKEYSITIDMLASRATDDFLYNSLRLYGKPTTQDVKNANYIIQSYSTNEEERSIDSKEVYDMFVGELQRWGMGGKVTLSKNMAARMMVNSSKRTLIINDKAYFNLNDIQLLSEHELGVHMLTTMNASKQPLKFLLLGTPKNIDTQEGIAILAESLTGNLHIDRLKELAYRVVAVNLMVKGYDFKEVFEYFIDEYNFSRDRAFNITTRVLRGGGFTKDHVYLKGFIKVYNYFKDGNSIEELLVGKTSLEFAELINELINRKQIIKPVYKNDIFSNGSVGNEVIEYILKSTT